MNHQDYTTEALRTWTAPLRGTEEGRTYLVLGLLSELGEVADVLKKAIRNGTPNDEVRRRLVDELGDVLWYNAATDYEYSIDDKAFYNAAMPPFVREALAGIDVGRILDHGGEKLLAWAFEAYGITAEECRAANIAKLRDRAARGVIAGEGGSR